MESKLTKIFLHGKLGQTYGKEWNLAVKSPAEAIRAIDINVKGALRKQLISEGQTKFYKICLGNEDNALDKNEVKNPSGNTDIHIIPVIHGNNSGVGKILAAIAIIIISIYVPPAAGWAIPGLTVGETVAVGVSAGLSLGIGGVLQLLSPVQGINYGSSNDDGRGSSIFQGNAGVTSQGAAVGLVYGRMLVTPMPVAMSFSNYDKSSPQGLDLPLQCYKVTYFADGLQPQYDPIDSNDPECQLNNQE